CQRDDTAQIEGVLNSQPKCQLTAGGMSGGDHALQIQVVAHCKSLDVFGAVQHVIHGAGPAAAGIADSPILEAPSRGSGTCQCCASVSGVVEAVGISPESAVNEDDNGMRARSAGQ